MSQLCRIQPIARASLTLFPAYLPVQARGVKRERRQRPSAHFFLLDRVQDEKETSPLHLVCKVDLVFALKSQVQGRRKVGLLHLGQRI